MKIHHFASAAAAVVVVAMAAPAFAQGTGFVGATVADIVTDGFGSESALGVEGGWATTAGAFTVQADGAYAKLDESDTNAFAVAGTAATSGEALRYGATVMYVDLDDDVSLIEGSLLAQGIGEKWVGVARFGYGSVDDGSASDTTYYDLNLSGQFFVTDNFALNLGADYLDIEGPTSEQLSASAGFEWKMGESPLSIGSGYSFNKDGHMVSLTLRGTFGAATLLDRAKNGPISNGVALNRVLGR